MNTIQTLSVPFYEFECPHTELIEKVCEEVRALPFNDEDPPPSTRTYYNAELFDWFTACLEEVRKIYYKDSIKLTISNGFATRMKRLHKARMHFHINSIVSGVFYLTSAETSKTKFQLPNPYYFAEHQKVLSLSNNKHDVIDTGYNALTTLLAPVKGKLVLFPSSIEHETLTHNEPFYRYIISFNTMATGVVSEKNTLRLEIETKKHIG